MTPGIYEALFLHYYEGWPVEALMKLFGATRRHVKYMLEKDCGKCVTRLELK